MALASLSVEAITISDLLICLDISERRKDLAEP
jgi:hypothetical protein